MTDVYQRVTEQIVAAIEAGAKGGDWKRPWHCKAGSGSPMPYNVTSKRCYRGINATILWAEAAVRGYTSQAWGTYRQFAERGAQVRKGEKATLIVFWKFDRAAPSDPVEGEEKPGKQRVMVRGYSVFNAAQVDGYSEKAAPVLPEAERDAAAEAWFASLDMKVRHGGDRACYIPGLDTVMMPEFGAFDTPTLYYSTLAHEDTHATGHASRCDRDLSGRFGNTAYAMEELIAELGAAFTCASLGLDAQPRPDHAQYVANWLTTLKNDKRAIFTAASKAQAAFDWMQAKQPSIGEDCEPDMEEAA